MTFKISFLFILALMNRKLILKSPRFLTFGANLAQLVSRSDIPVDIQLTCDVTRDVRAEMPSKGENSRTRELFPGTSNL